MVRYTIDDREGDAISGDSYRLQLSYVFLGQGYTVASNVAYGGSSQDARNPIFGVTTDSDRYAVDTTLFYRLPAASGRWQAVGSILWGKDDYNVSVLRQRGVQRQRRRDVSLRRPLTPVMPASRGRALTSRSR